MLGPSITNNNMKIKINRYMADLLMKSPRFSTQAPMRSGNPYARLSSVSAEMLRQAKRTFSMRMASDVAGCVLSTLSWTSTHTGFRGATGLGCFHEVVWQFGGWYNFCQLTEAAVIWAARAVSEASVAGSGRKWRCMADLKTGCCVFFCSQFSH